MGFLSEIFPWPAPDPDWSSEPVCRPLKTRNRIRSYFVGVWGWTLLTLSSFGFLVFTVIKADYSQAYLDYDIISDGVITAITPPVLPIGGPQWVYEFSYRTQGDMLRRATSIGWKRPELRPGSPVKIVISSNDSKQAKIEGMFIPGVRWYAPLAAALFLTMGLYYSYCGYRLSRKRLRLWERGRLFRAKVRSATPIQGNTSRKRYLIHLFIDKKAHFIRLDSVWKYAIGGEAVLLCHSRNPELAFIEPWLLSNWQTSILDTEVPIDGGGPSAPGSD